MRPAQQELAEEGTLYRTHVHDVARWSERLGGPHLDVEDIVHEVFMIAYRKVGSFRGDSSVSTWLFGITHRVVRHRRRKERWRRWLSGSADETAGHLPSPGHDPLRQAERREAVAEVYAVLDTLSERDRQILILCELEEMTADEVGRLLGIEPANARLRLHRAKARFVSAHAKFQRSQSLQGALHAFR